jgi:hypothetical protein
MPTITLPTEAERAAVDTTGFTWSNSEPGNLTKAHGALVKLITDQLASGEGVKVLSPGRGTGKTPKFIVENSTNGADLKIVMKDNFADNKADTVAEANKTGPYSTFVNATTKANVNVLLGSIDNVYLQDMNGVIGWTLGETDVTYTNTTTSAVMQTLDTASMPTPFADLTDEEIAAQVANDINVDFHTKEELLNKDDAKLDGGGSDKFIPDVVMFCPAPQLTSTYLQLDGDAATRADAWLKRELSCTLHRLFTQLPVGGVLIYDKIHFERVNGALQDALAKLDSATYDSCLYNNTEADYTGAYQSMAIKKLA